MKTFHSQPRAEQVLQKLVRYLGADPALRKLQREKGFRYIARPSGRYYIVAIEPLDRESLRKLLPAVRRHFPDAFSNRYSPPVSQSGAKKPSVVVTEEKAPSLDVPETEGVEKEAKKEEEKADTPRLSAALDKTPAAKQQEPDTQQVDPSAAIEAVEKAEKSRLAASNPPLEEVQAQESLPPMPPSASQAKPEASVPAAGSEGDGKSLFAAARYLPVVLAAGLLLALAGWFLFRKRDARKNGKEKIQSVGPLLDQMDRPVVSALENIYASLKTLHEKAGEESEIKKELRQIEREGIRIETALADAKDIATLAAGGEPESHLRRFDLNDILEQLAETFSAEKAANSIGMVYDVDTEMPIRFIGDGKRLKRMLYHILYVAALRMRCGGCIYLSVREEREERDEEESRTWLIWKIVCRSEGSLAARSDASSWHADLGARLANLLGAQTDLLEDERGMIWKMGMPIEVYDVKNRRKYHLPSRSYLKKRIYIVDPDRVAAKSLEKMLRFFHYQVRYLESLAERDRRQKEPWDMLFIEESALREEHALSVEELKKRMGRKVIVVARHAHMETLHYEFGDADGFLGRPFTHRQLLGLIVRQLGQHWY